MYSGGARGDVKTWVVDMDAQQEKVGLLHETHCVDSSRSEQNDGQVYGLLQFEQREELAVAHDDRITVLHKNGLQELLSWRYGSRGSVTAGGSRNPHNMAYVFDSTVHETSVFAGLSDGSVRGRDLRSPLYDTLCIDDAHDSHVTCCAVSGSGTYILSGSGRGGTALYDRRATENGPLWRKLPSDGETPRPIYGGTFWPQRDDLMMTWSSSGDLCFMDAKGRRRRPRREGAEEEEEEEEKMSQAGREQEQQQQQQQLGRKQHLLTERGGALREKRQLPQKQLHKHTQLVLGGGRSLRRSATATSLRRRSSLVEVFAEPDPEAGVKNEGPAAHHRRDVGTKSSQLRAPFSSCARKTGSKTQDSDGEEETEDKEEDEGDEEENDDFEDDDARSAASSNFYSISGEESADSIAELWSPLAVRYHRLSSDNLGLVVSIAQGGLQRIRREAQSAQVSLRDVVDLFGKSIANMARIADGQVRPPNAITSFDGVSVPSITMSDYIWRIVQSLNAQADPAHFASDGSELSELARCTSPRRRASTDSLDVHPSPGETALEGEHSAMGRGLRCLLLALVYIDRAYTRHPDAFCIRSVSMHRIVLTAMYLAAKFTDDTLPHSHWTFARLGGISCSELRSLEVCFCHLVDYRLYVTEAEFQALCMEQLRCAVRNARELRQARQAAKNGPSLRRNSRSAATMA
ncbi:Cyclin-P3-1 [Hondaea fermentalgiana]|uniref:Cyclin-P3-1 n=1 Tax=Hondaea fermentalgiana TaxID=2315210 RepID=A0A2R5GL48_9STRA|nr:Cyclin-P3-1 [Hondaea fermentalgiana]|eukprot:GBG29001.1 Cyclin-P3-1 [Hondaea fermentalgiana]